MSKYTFELYTFRYFKNKIIKDNLLLNHFTRSCISTTTHSPCACIYQDFSCTCPYTCCSWEFSEI